MDEHQCGLRGQASGCAEARQPPPPHSLPASALIAIEHWPPPLRLRGGGTQRSLRGPSACAPSTHLVLSMGINGWLTQGAEKTTRRAGRLTPTAMVGVQHSTLVAPLRWAASTALRSSIVRPTVVERVESGIEGRACRRARWWRCSEGLLKLPCAPPSSGLQGVSGQRVGGESVQQSTLVAPLRWAASTALRSSIVRPTGVERVEWDRGESVQESTLVVLLRRAA